MTINYVKACRCIWRENMRRIIISSCLVFCTNLNAADLILPEKTVPPVQTPTPEPKTEPGTINLPTNVIQDETEEKESIGIDKILQKLREEAIQSQKREEQRLQDKRVEEEIQSKKREEQRLEDQRVEEDVENAQLQQQRLQQQRLDTERERQRATNRWLEERALDRKREERRIDQRRWEESQRRR